MTSNRESDRRCFSGIGPLRWSYPVTMGKSVALIFSLVCALWSGAAQAQSAYITGSELNLIDVTTNTLAANLPSISGFAIARSPDGAKLYVSKGSTTGIDVIDTATNSVVYSIATPEKSYGIAISPDGTKLYATQFVLGGQVLVIDTASNSITATWSLGISSTYGIGLSPDGAVAYVSSYSGNGLYVVNTTNGNLVATVPMGVLTTNLAVSPDGSRVYVNNFISANVSVLNTTTNSVVATVAIVGGPVGIDVTPDGSRVYVSVRNSGTVAVIDAATPSFTSSIPVGSGPAGVRVSTDGSTVLVANRTSRTVSVIRTATNTVVATIAVSGAPDYIGPFTVPAVAVPSLSFYALIALGLLLGSVALSRIRVTSNGHGPPPAV